MITKEEYFEAMRNARLLDDEFMSIVFEDDLGLTEFPADMPDFHSRK